MTFYAGPVSIHETEVRHMTYFEIASIIITLIELIFVIIDRCNKK